MIRSLEDAWNWYASVRKLAYDMKHLAGRWDRPEWNAVLSLDNRLRERTAAELNDMANTVLADLDDLAVLVLFSVFEASVRAQAGADVVGCLWNHPTPSRHRPCSHRHRNNHRKFDQGRGTPHIACDQRMLK